MTARTPEAKPLPDPAHPFATIGNTGYVDTGDVDVQGLRRRIAGAPTRVTVVMPVHNAAAAVSSSVDALLRHTDPDADILFVDDASTQPEIPLILGRASSRRGVRIVRNDENLGFTRTVNLALSMVTGGDVVLLNSDAEVGPMWLQRLRWTAYSADAVGTVSAVSNQAGSMSVPIPHQNNPWHPRLERADVSRIVARGMQVWSQEVPAGHGFCLYLTRAGLDAVGAFDEASFPRGYGEEVDFSQRAIGKGLVNLVAPHVMVAHRRGQSFGPEDSRILREQSRPVLERLHPTLRAQVTAWETSVGDRLIRLVAHGLAHRSARCWMPVILLAEPSGDPARGPHPGDEHHAILRIVGDGVLVESQCPGDARPTLTTYSEGDIDDALVRIVLREAVESIRVGGDPSSLSERVRALAEILRITVAG